MSGWVAAGAAVVGAGTAVYSASQAGKGGSIPQTAQGQQAAYMALDQYNTYLKDFKPTEEGFIADTMKPTTVAEATQVGKAHADIEQKSAIPSGIDPNRINNNPSAFANTAAIESATDTNVREGVQSNKIGKEQALVGVGRGQASNAQLSMDNLATAAEQQAIGDKQASVTKQGQITNAVGSLAGGVGAIAKNWPTTPTVDGYSPTTDYSGAGAPGPYAIGATSNNADYVAPVPEEFTA